MRINVKNLTSHQVGVKVREITGDRGELEIYLSPNGNTVLVNMVVVQPEQYEGILEIEGYSKSLAPIVESEDDINEEVLCEDTDDSESYSEEDVDNDEDDVEDSPVVEEDVPKIGPFVCDICGTECASARGLALHKSRAHSE